MGFFINKYNSSNNITINDSVKTNDAIYNCGEGPYGKGYIRKLDFDGNVLWSKKYTFASNVTFQNIFYDGNSVICNFETNNASNSQYEAGLISINPEGNIIWCKTFFRRVNHPVSNIKTRNIYSYLKFLNQHLVLVIKDAIHLTNQNLGTHDLYFIKVSLNGSQILNQKKLNGNSISLVAAEIITLENSIIIVGNTDKGIIIKLDTNFNFSLLKTITYGSNNITSSRIENISEKTINGFLFIRGFIVLNSIFHTFVAKVNSSTFQINKFIYKSYSSQTAVDFIVEGSFLYEANPNGLSKYNELLDIVFTKKINNNPVKIDKISNNEIYGHQGGSGFNIIFKTDLNLDTCITNSISNPILTAINGISFVNSTSPTFNNYSESFYNKTVSVGEVSLSIEILCPGTQIPSLKHSIITAIPPTIPTGGGTDGKSEITVRLYDTNNNPINNGTYDVVIFRVNNIGTLVSTGGSNGIYTANLFSSNQVESAVIGFKIDNVPSDNYATVDFIAEGSVIVLNENTSLQSPHIYLQAAGSDGTESTKGRHLRWAFRGALGEKHLPKGNNATGTANFNKPQDFVTIYRAGYNKKAIRLNFVQTIPAVVDHSNYLWIYRILGKEFYIRFGNATKYDFVKNSFNPLSQPYQFLNAYGNELVEIENIKELFFKVTCNFSSISDIGLEGEFKVETLSVEKNSITSNKIISNRRIIEGTSINNSLVLVCENGRSIRWKRLNVNLTSMDFEFYLDTITEINSTTGWENLGDFALSLNDGTTFSQLEPTDGDVHGIWQRFNDDSFVNINNYKDKWNGTPDTGARNIKQTVTNYINLSNTANNPAAIEEVPLGNDPNDPNDYISISNLDLLNLAANDYHVSRLLGLGILDIDSPLRVVIKKGDETETIYVDPKPNYLYIAEYFTTADLEDGLGARNVHHLFMSLPTTNIDTRLPIPLNLSHLTPGVFLGGMGGELSPLTDVDGYTHDGLSRYVSIYSQDLPSDEINPPFFNSLDELNLGAITTPVYGGLEHRIGLEEWDKPELSNDPEYNNVVASGTPHYETRFILIPEPQQPFYIHRQTANGLHTYSSYGINWFSRASARPTQISINTLLTPANPLKAPINTQSLLIRSESPLFLTSRIEQDRLVAITDDDKTLIRLFFNYHNFNELKSYKVPLNSPLSNIDLITDTTTIYNDNDEIFADKVEILFRDRIPQNIRGKVLSVEDHPTYEILSVLTTGEYYIASTGETIIPTIPPGGASSFIGGVIVLGNEKFIIHEVATGISGPIITVYKKQISDSITGGNGPTNAEGYIIDLPITNGDFPEIQTGTELQSPIIAADGYFMAIENMQSIDSWGTPNPLDYFVKIGIGWNIHREVLEITDEDGNVERHLEKSRGIWENATISEVLEPTAVDEFGNVISTGHLGKYRLTFEGYTLFQHSTPLLNTNTAEYYQGVVRIFTENSIQNGVAVQRRKILPVLKIQNIIPFGEPDEDLVLIVEDPTFEIQNYDGIPTGNNIMVNFYPGYKVYLYNNREYGLTENDLLPLVGEGMRYSIFGFRSVASADNFSSKISAPAVMFAEEIITPKQPDRPQGPVYATRPDFFGRSTYTIKTKFNQKPHGVLIYRSNDEALLNAIYERSTILQIRAALKALGGNDEEWLTDRWENFLDFEILESFGFQEYPPSNGYKFPNPDKQAFFDWANKILYDLEEGQITDPPGTLAVNDPKIFEFFKGALYSAFVPLTELPILYKYLNGAKYQPINKKQVVKDSNGYVIPPVDPKISPPVETEFDMAPMMKIVDEEAHLTLFTDFNLDGTSNNLYFYGARELGTKMKMSDFSPFLGPIKLINTNPPEAPEIKRIMPVLGNDILGISPHIKIEVNAYPEIQKIEKLTIYRAKNRLDAQSIRSMEIVKIIDLGDENLLDEPIWTAHDKFEDLLEIPYGDGLFYRITVSRKVEYAESDGTIITEYAPSLPSKIVATMIVEVSAPHSPVLKFISTPPDTNDVINSVSLIWKKTAYNAKYHLYKMNNQGNWYKIHQLQTNDDEVQVSLNDTDLQDDSLVLSENGQNRYHHFKVVAENTAGMLSREENILTIFNENDWIEI